MRLILFAVILCGAEFACGQNPTQMFEKLTFMRDRQKLPYRLLKPADASQAKKFPLVIFLHGAGERGTDNEAQLKHIQDLFLDAKNRKDYPCFVLAPQCPTGEWWAEHNRDGSTKSEPAATSRLLIQLLDEVLKKYPVDVDRIYLTGVSMGGYGVWDLLVRFPDRFAAAVPVCGGGDVKAAARIKHVPIWAFHGVRDTVVPPRQSRSMIQAIQNAGGTPGYTEYPDVGHDSWVPAYQERRLLPWLFSKRLTSNFDTN